jgi:hypothetical protein
MRSKKIDSLKAVDFLHRLGIGVNVKSLWCVSLALNIPNGMGSLSAIPRAQGCPLYQNAG